MSEKEVRLIDAQQLYTCRTCRYHGCCDFIVTCDHGEMYSPDMSKLETIDPESLRPHGKPVPHYKSLCNSDGEPIITHLFGYECPFCGDPDIKKFCPNCGAKMCEEVY